MVRTNRNDCDIVCSVFTYIHTSYNYIMHKDIVIYYTYYAYIHIGIGIYAHMHSHIIGMSRTRVYVLLFSLDPYLDKLAPKKGCMHIAVCIINNIGFKATSSYMLQ